MARSTIYSLAAIAVATITFAAVWVSAKNTPPGFERYTPTRLEWAALELQASHGDTWSPTEQTVMLSYRPGDDGLTIVCVLQYTAGTTSSLLGMVRDTTKQVFAIYKDAKKWPWLRLEFQEKELG